MRKSTEIIFNLLFWALIIYLYYSYNVYLHELSGNNFKSNAGGMLWNTYFPGYWYLVLFYSVFFIGPFINFYLFYFIFVPNFLFRKRVFLLISLSLLPTFLIGYVPRWVFYYHKDIPLQDILRFLFIVLLCGIVGGVMKGFILWRNSLVEKIAIEKKHMESKTALLMLQSQLNPHFLFNSLNNIDILVEDNPKTASEYLKKLSDILRYALYDTKEDIIALSKEIEQIKNFIELQKIRTNNQQFVTFNIKGELINQRIAPMIFLPFIENAFKHCNNKSIKNAIEIEFELKSDKITMVCKNYYETKQLNVINREGLGIGIIEQRLNLLYPQKHDLYIDKADHLFIVKLSIYLKNEN